MTNAVLGSERYEDRIWPRDFSVVGEVFPIMMGIRGGKSAGLEPNVLGGVSKMDYWRSGWMDGLL